MEEMPCSRVVLLVQLMIISLIINSAASESYSSMIRSHRKAAYAAFLLPFYGITALYNFYATSEVDEASLHKA